jgi:hypothetical protein
MSLAAQTVKSAWRKKRQIARISEVFLGVALTVQAHQQSLRAQTARPKPITKG